MIKTLSKYIEEIDDEMYVPFNADRSLGQNQYASRYATGRIENWPNLGKDLRWKNIETSNYHNIKIHIDDLLTFHARVQRQEAGIKAGVIL